LMAFKRAGSLEITPTSPNGETPVPSNSETKRSIGQVWGLTRANSRKAKSAQQVSTMITAMEPTLILRIDQIRYDQIFRTKFTEAAQTIDVLCSTSAQTHLKKVPFLAKATDEELALLVSVSQFHAYKEKSVVFKEGEIGRSFYVVLRGNVEIRVYTTLGSAQLGSGSKILGTSVNKGRNAVGMNLQNIKDGFGSGTYNFSKAKNSSPVRKSDSSSGSGNMPRISSASSTARGIGGIHLFNELNLKATKVVKDCQNGEYFGEMGIMIDKPRAASAYCPGDTLLLELDKKDFLSVIESNPAIKQDVTNSLKMNLTSELSRSNNPLFRSVMGSRLCDNWHLFSIGQFDLGDSIYSIGTEGSTCFIIVFGRVQLVTANGTSTLHDEGYVFGEECLFEPRRKRHHNAKCVSENLVLLEIDNTCLNTIYEDNPHPLAKLRLQILWDRGSLEDLLLQPEGPKLLHNNCKKELNEENILFYEEAMAFIRRHSSMDDLTADEGSPPPLVVNMPAPLPTITGSPLLNSATTTVERLPTEGGNKMRQRCVSHPVFLRQDLMPLGTDTRWGSREARPHANTMVNTAPNQIPDRINESQQNGRPYHYTIDEDATYLYKKYIVDDADYQINIPNKMRKELDKIVNDGTFSWDMYVGASDEIYRLLEKNNFARLVKTQEYEDFLREHVGDFECKKGLQKE